MKPFLLQKGFFYYNKFTFTLFCIKPSLMKSFISSICLLFLINSCKSSLTKAELIQENNILKERILELESTNNQDLKAAVELKKMNVVYRGLNNPIYISKPNAVSFEASAPGLKKIDSLGNYKFSPGRGRTVDIIIKSKLNNGDTLTEKKTLRIKDIGLIYITVNNIGCGTKCIVQLTKEELMNIKVGVKAIDFLFDWKLKVNGFKIHFQDNSYNIEGNLIDNQTKHKIKNLKKGDRVIIYDIKSKIQKGGTHIRYKNPAPVIINIVD